jgi:hypothetical protein
MDAIRLHRRFAAWLAIWALLVAALWPALVQAAVGGAGKSDWIEVCSASGMVWVKADGSTEPQDHRAQDKSQHCDWCSLHSGSGLPPDHADMPGLVADTRAIPAFHATAPRPAEPLATRSRAPPLPA